MKKKPRADKRTRDRTTQRRVRGSVRIPGLAPACNWRVRARSRIARDSFSKPPEIHPKFSISWFARVDFFQLAELRVSA